MPEINCQRQIIKLKKQQSKLLICLQFDILEIPISVLFGKIKNSNAVIWELLGKDI